MNSRSLRTTVGAVLFCAAGLPILLSAACGESNSQVAHANRLTGTGEPALHAVHNAQLQELMGEIDRLATQGDFARPLELAQKQDEAIHVGESLVRDAEVMKKFGEKLELSDEERMIYEKMATKLQQQAGIYLNAAKKKDFNDMERALNTMTSTCDACHSTFRQM